MPSKEFSLKLTALYQDTRSSGLSEEVQGAGLERYNRPMQGLREILRALAIVLLAVAGTGILYGSANGLETAIGLALIQFALGLIATWFWQPW